MSFYKEGFNLERDIRNRKDVVINKASVYSTTVVNNPITSTSSVILNQNQVSTTSTGFNTGGSNIIDSNGHIINGDNNNVVGNNVLVSSNNNTVTSNDVVVLGGSNNNVDGNNNVLINTSGYNVVGSNQTLIGGDMILSTSNISPFIHILYGVENGFNELKNINIVAGGNNTTRPLWGDDNNHIVNGDATNILYQ
jgi:hypothetical protein